VTSSAAGPSVHPHLTSNRIRRHQPEPPQAQLADGAQPKITAAEPPVPDKPPRPLGDLSAASAAWIADLAAERFSVERNGRALNRRGMLWLLERLAEFPGARGSSVGSRLVSTTRAVRWTTLPEKTGKGGPGSTLRRSTPTACA
jgi:hypothetical protein